jgi:hypothetical protein
MSTPDAAYTIAHQRGIDVAKYLSSEETARVRELITQLGPVTSGTSVASASRRSKSVPKPTTVSIAGAKVTDLPGMTTAHAKEAKEMAEKVYPALYVFENSARDIIMRTLKGALGDDWWANGVATDLQNKARDRRADESKEPWHGRRGARDIDYLDLPDLAKIVKGGKAWRHFEAVDIFPRASWFEELVSDMNVSRRVIAHMNPLSADDIKHIEATFRKWARQLEAKREQIPS